MALSILQIINIAKISGYLSLSDVQKGSLFGKRIAPDTPKVLYMERKAVEWMYNLDPADDTLRLTANYLYSLCRGYNLRAQAVSGTGGSISPVDPINAPDPYDFTVSGSSFITAGSTTKTITAFIGFNLLFVRGGIPQSTINSGGTYYSWNRNTGEFVCSPALQSGEEVQLYPV